eukprot:12006997-Alexandrium_andersonii.AAC.1
MALLLVVAALAPRLELAPVRVGVFPRASVLASVFQCVGARARACTYACFDARVRACMRASMRACMRACAH